MKKNLLKNLAKTLVWLNNLSKLEVLFLFLTLGVIYYVHSLNLFNYPYYENDEGTYMTQAWSLLEQNKLAPYTYWYDHAPFGWIFIAFFVKIVGGFYTFGTAVDTGRVMMLVLHLISSFFIIRIIKNATGNIWAGYIGALFFSMLPLGNYFQRRVLLDNLMVFWLILAVYFLSFKNLKLRHIIASSALFGLAILTKESAAVFILGMLVLVLTGLSMKQRLMGLYLYLTFLGGTLMMYILLAVLKTELFPSSNKVSLLGTLRYQAGRGKELKFWQQGSDFYNVALDWIVRDYNSVIAIFSASVLVCLFTLINFKNRIYLGFLTLFLGYTYFMFRGGIVLEFYVIPWIAILSLLVGLCFNSFWVLFEQIRNKIKYPLVLNKFLQIVFFVFISGGLLMLPLKLNTIAFSQNETIQYSQMVDYIRQNLNEDAKIIIDCGVWMELRDSKDGTQKKFKNADWYWKADSDPEIKRDLLREDPKNIDYIFATFQYFVDMKSQAIPFNQKAFYESKLIKDFTETKITSSLYKVIKSKEQILKNTWLKYKQDFVTSEGQVIDKDSNNTTSESQGYGMLRALWSNDQAGFDKIWEYTRNKLQVRKEDKLIAWKLTKDKNDSSKEIVNLENATDGDLDIALALALAGRKWSNKQQAPNQTQTLNSEYSNWAKEIINDIYKLRVTRLGSNLVLLPFNSQALRNETAPYEILNPSYFSPAHYKVFAEIDKTNDWNGLAFDTYDVLNKITKNRVLPPNWIKYDFNSNSYVSAQVESGKEADNYGYDAFRVFWRTGLDYRWYKNDQAKIFISKYKEFFEKEFTNTNIIKSSYNRDGNSIENYESTSTDVAAQTVLEISESSSAGPFWRQKFIERVDLETQTFDSKNNYYNQNWGWLGMATKEGIAKKDF